MTAPTFDINAAIQALREGQDLTGKDGILTPLIKQLTVRTVKRPKPSRVQWVILSSKPQETGLVPLSLSWLKSIKRS
jgi:hypothetical protein